MKKKQTHCNRGHALVPENLYSYASGRQCKICVIENARERAKRKTIERHEARARG